MNFEALDTGQVQGEWPRNPAVPGEEAAVRANPDLATTVRAKLRGGKEDGEPPPGQTQNLATGTGLYDQATAQTT